MMSSSVQFRSVVGASLKLSNKTVGVCRRIVNMFVELFLTLCVFVVFRFLWTRWKYDLHKIPSPPGLPILGHTLEFSRGMAGKSFSRWFRPHYEALGYPRVVKAQKRSVLHHGKNLS